MVLRTGYYCERVDKRQDTSAGSRLLRLCGSWWAIARIMRGHVPLTTLGRARPIFLRHLPAPAAPREASGIGIRAPGPCGAGTARGERGEKGCQRGKGCQVPFPSQQKGNGLREDGVGLGHGSRAASGCGRNDLPRGPALRKGYLTPFSRGRSQSRAIIWSGLTARSQRKKLKRSDVP